MKLMNYELPLGISVTQHPAEMIDEFVENGFEVFRGRHTCKPAKTTTLKIWRGAAVKKSWLKPSMI